MRIIALAALLIASQAHAAVDQPIPDTRIQSQSPIDEQSGMEPCNRVIVLPWFMIGPDGEMVRVGDVAIRRSC